MSAPSPQPGPVEIRVEGLRKSFGARPVLRDINAEFASGQIIAVVGASGSGKTVLLDHLVGLMAPDSGRVLVADHDGAPGPAGARGAPLADLAVVDEETLDRIRLRWAVVFQRNALFTGTVRDNIALWLTEHTSLPPAQVDERIRKSLGAAMLDVADVIDKDRDALSGGMAKRVAIARAVAVDPLVLFYDEPTTGLDPIVAGHIHELIFRVHHLPVGELFQDAPRGKDGAARGAGGVGGVAGRTAPAARTSIIVTHDKDLLRRVRPRVLMLHEGRVCYDGPYDGFGASDCPPAQEYLAEMPVLHEGGVGDAGG